jgi:hypothetical protein
MPDFAKGVAAVKKVQKDIKDVAALTKKIQACDSKGAVTSCALTAKVVGDAISSKALAVAQGFASKKASDKVAIIKGLLDAPKMVYVNIVPDHHFIVVPIDDDKVSILQGFQGVYNLIEWIDNRGEGVLKKSEFVDAMGDLVSKDKGKVQAAAIKLFSYSLAYEGKTASAPAKKVEKEIKAYYPEANVNIANVGSVDL